MNALELLQEDHDRIMQLFDAVKLNENGNNTLIFEEIKQELETVIYIKEAVFYPKVISKGSTELRKIAIGLNDGYRQAKTLVNQLGALKATNDNFNIGLQLLIENIEQHIDDEEGKMFLMIDQQFEGSELETLGAQLEAQKANFMKRKSSAKKFSFLYEGEQLPQMATA